ncbi:MAG TPA: ATP-binding protein [Verrucomicrobiae bacterium]|nr:ATP-binding protein [Verrucomicrobiae bacterium]
MNDASAQRGFSFKAKILFPVVAMMALLLVSLFGIVNHHISHQIQTETAQRLARADAIFANLQKIRTKNLLLRYSNIPNEPRFKSVCQLGEPKAMRFLLNELAKEQDSDMITFTTSKGEHLASVRRDSEWDLAQFESAASVSAEHALEGQPNVDTVVVSARLFDIVSVPVTMGERVIGVLTFGTEIGDTVVREFQQLTRSQMILLAHDDVAASTLQGTEAQEEFASVLGSDALATRNHEPVVLGGEHFLALAGHFPSQSGDQRVGYVLLTSYQQPLYVLHSLQRGLFLFGLLAITISALLFWKLTDRVTRTLRQVREAAERLGRDDFSKRIDVQGCDECGELALAFNKMTGNLQASREELEKTVESLKKTEAQLTQSEKLSVIGEFVAGVAHELNNPLASVYGFAQLLNRPDSAKDEKHDHYVERILHESRRCQKIVQNLLSFARQSPPERKRLNLNDLVHSSLEILQYQLRASNIEVTTALDEKLPAVIGDSHQLQQVFVNIINNARQAVESYRSSGTLRITTVARAGRVRVSFKDNGPGVSGEHLKKMFTPFFTTKEVGKGTGLGLSLCYGIVNEHGGTITVSSTFGEGATFMVELPVAEAAGAESPMPSTARPETRAASQKSGKRVLVVDDEEALRDLISETLAAERYDVDTAADGEAALRKTNSAHYDLIICDWKMPGVNGLEFYHQLKAKDPVTAGRFIFLTGDVVGAQKALGNQGSNWLLKPFCLDDLRSAVEKVATAD